MTKRVGLLFVIALGGGCGADPEESSSPAENGPTIPGGPAEGSGGAQPDGPDTTSTLPPKPAGDEHGVRVAGGQTTDFGNAQSPPPQCSTGETLELSVEAARGAGIDDIDAGLALLDRQYDAPFHTGVCDGECAADEADTSIRVSAEPIAVYRTSRIPIEGRAEPEDCPDAFEYYTVVAVETADGGLSGRFHARLDQYTTRDGETRLGTWAVPLSLSADLQNFDGSWLVPVALERPYWGAMHTSVSFGESGARGTFSVVFNYTDNDVPSTWGARASSETGDGPVGVGGWWPATGNPDAVFLARGSGPVGAPTVTLSDYRASAITPTCLVTVSIHVQATEEGAYNPFEPVDTQVLINGVAHSWTDPPFPQASTSQSATVGGPPVPWDIGRLPIGSTIEIDVRSTTPTGAPHAGIEVSPFSVATRCTGPGCVAHLEHRLTQYCER